MKTLNLQMKEVDTASVLVQWKVPVQIPVEATPRPVLPEQCVSKDDQAVVEQPGGRVYTESFRCEGGLDARLVVWMSSDRRSV